MSTTSLKLPRQLKERAAAIAKRKGVSTHAFPVSAIEDATETEEARLRVVDIAKKAPAKTRKTGTGYDSERVHQYIRRRVSGKQSPRPEEDSVWRD